MEVVVDMVPALADRTMLEEEDGVEQLPIRGFRLFGQAVSVVFAQHRPRHHQPTYVRDEWQCL